MIQDHQTHLLHSAWAQVSAFLLSSWASDWSGSLELASDWSDSLVITCSRQQHNCSSAEGTSRPCRTENLSTSLATKGSQTLQRFRGRGRYYHFQRKSPLCVLTPVQSWTWYVYLFEYNAAAWQYFRPPLSASVASVRPAAGHYSVNCVRGNFNRVQVRGGQYAVIRIFAAIFLLFY